MSIVVDPYTAVDGADILAAEINARYSTLFSLVNGNLDNANVKVGAAIDPAKLDLTKEIFDVRAAAARCLSAGTTGDTVPRVSLTADGKIYFGPGGGTAIDTILKRDAAGILRVRDATDAADASLRLLNLYLNGNVVSDLLAQACIPGGRLTLTSGTPVTTSDVTAATNVYYAIDKHNLIPAYSSADGKLVLRAFTEITIGLAGLAANTNFDVYVKWNGAAWVGSTVAWAGDTTRAATVPTRLPNSSVYVSSADSEAMWVGTIRTTSTIGQCEDSAARRFVSNLHNRVVKPLYAADGATASWSYTTATWREFNGAATEGTSRCGMVRCDDRDAVRASVLHHSGNTVALVTRSIAVGVDTSTVPLSTLGRSQPNFTNGVEQMTSHYIGHPGAGYHTIRALEYSGASGTTTWHNFISQQMQSGLSGEGLF